MALGLFGSNPDGYTPCVQRSNAVFRHDYRSARRSAEAVLSESLAGCKSSAGRGSSEIQGCELLSHDPEEPSEVLPGGFIWDSLGLEVE
jgi:hypothetical protein